MSEVYYRYTAADGSVVIVNDPSAIPEAAREHAVRTDLPEQPFTSSASSDAAPTGTFSIVAHDTSTPSRPGSLHIALGTFAAAMLTLLVVLTMLLRRKRRWLVRLALTTALLVAGGAAYFGLVRHTEIVTTDLAIPSPTSLIEDAQRAARAAGQHSARNQAILDAIGEEPKRDLR